MTALENLMSRLAAIRDPGLHGSLVRDFLESHEPVELVDVLASLLARASDEHYRVLYDSFVDVFVADSVIPIPYHVTQEIYRIAGRRNERAVALMLLDPPPLRRADGWSGDPDPEILDLTLGERKSFARRLDRDLLARMTRVTEPEVLRILLSNPRLTESDVVGIAARRPNTVSALTEVVRRRRWRVASTVRMALVNNPYLPPRLAVLLVPGLPRQERARLRHTPGLHPLIAEMSASLSPHPGGTSSPDSAPR